jgi:CRISPR-associated endonuclease/helicase Cas3
MLKSGFDGLLAAMFPHHLPTERDQVLRAICGHHGRPPQESVFRQDCGVCQDVAATFVADLQMILEPTPLPDLDLSALSWWLAGLTVLADWIGSNEAWFPYEPTSEGLPDYWPVAQSRAAAANAAAGVLPIMPSDKLTAPDLLPLGAAASPLQHAILTLDLGPTDAATLVIVEDQTGSGKTEAALLLAHRLMAEKSARGLFIALPTMATANALYERLDLLYRKLFEAGPTAPSLVLAHGRQKLHDRFMASIAEISAGSPSDDVSDETASAQCAGWIAADRRRAFFADCGVGTIDQALHAVLPTRHAPLRLLGLRERVLIIDEAHAYDTYMQEELFRLVEFQRRLGGHVIVLSATLPNETRQKLTRASGVSAACTNSSYPLVTVAAADMLVEAPSVANPRLRREIEIIRLPDASAALAVIERAAALGGAVGWIRNTVDDAIAACTLLGDAGVDTILFHARFAMGDRQRLEANVQSRVGKASDGEQRRVVIVSTQVMEQSLDIDFDLLISDLAPVDLLLQRAGRLWRHERRDRLVASPQFYIISPDPVAEPPANWLHAMPGTCAVYRHPALLWRSARVIFAKPELSLPADVRKLVESVYAPCAEIPAHLQEKSDAAEGAQKSAASVAWMNLLKWDLGYSSSNGAWESDVKTPTRLSEPSRIFRLAVKREDGLRPWFEDAKIERAWALSEISLQLRFVQDAPAAPDLLSLRASWPKFDQDVPVLVLRFVEGNWITEGLDKSGKPISLRYRSETGLQPLLN